MSKHTTEALETSTEHGEALFSFRSSYGSWNGFSKALDDETIWLDQNEEERVFDEKLQTFLDLEHGKRPERTWLLRGSQP